MPTTPLLLYDNVFDTMALYQAGTLDALSATTGREAFRVADYRRERSSWLPADDGAPNGNWVRVDLGAGVTRGVDYLVLDRGHNLWGQTVTLEGGPDGATWDVSHALTIPASGTVGGDPTAGASVTEEGAVWTLFPALAARRWWRLRVNYVAAFIPVVTGVMAGLRTQLLGYSTIFDEDAGERTEVAETSKTGYRATDTTYSWRTAQLGLAMIGAAEYDSTIRDLRRILFAKNQPTMLFLDYVSYPARGWLFRVDGARWNMAKQRATRAGQIPLREVGASLA